MYSVLKSSGTSARVLRTIFLIAHAETNKVCLGVIVVKHRRTVIFFQKKPPFFVFDQHREREGKDIQSVCRMPNDNETVQVIDFRLSATPMKPEIVIYAP